MRKACCIALVSFHLLNVVGGYWLFNFLQDRNKAHLAEIFDIDSYAGSQAITIKFPVSVFKGSNNGNYERVDGEMEYEGVVYRMIKQKFYNDTVYVVCYNDRQTLALKNAQSDLVKSLADNPTEKQSDSKVGLSFLKDYLHQAKSTVNVSRNAVDIARNVCYVNDYHHQLDFAIDHPPEFIG